MKTIKKSVKENIKIFKDFFKSLNWWQRAIFIIIIILCKLGPGLITFPILIKIVKTRMKNKSENN